MKKKNSSHFKVSSFFAGIGGFDLALERQGFESVYQCELNSFCSQVLETHWPGVNRAKDIRYISANEIPESDIWCGGFPCQDVSVARGNKGREGLRGKNSGLFFSFLEHIRARSPRVLLLENVVGLLSSHNGQDFRVILEELNSLGYSVAWRIMNSRYFGAPQSRPRVFICAARDAPQLPLKVLYEHREAGTYPKSARAGFLQVEKCEQSGAIVPRVAYCLAATSGRHTGTDWSRTYVSYEKAVRRLTPSECEGLQGFPHGWTDLSSVLEGYSSDNDSPRYQALGNAVSVPVVEWIAKNLSNALKKHSVKTLASFEDIVADFPDFQHFSNRYMALSDLRYSIKPNGHCLKWQSGGFTFKDMCVDFRAPEAPSKVIEKPLLDVIEKRAPALHYYLSSNAAEGILRRVNSQNRTLFEPMSSALKQLASAE